MAWLSQLFVQHVVDLQVFELAGLLGMLLEIAEVAAEIAARGVIASRK